MYITSRADLSKPVKIGEGVLFRDSGLACIQYVQSEFVNNLYFLDIIHNIERRTGPNDISVQYV